MVSNEVNPLKAVFDRLHDHPELEALPILIAASFYMVGRMEVAVVLTDGQAIRHLRSVLTWPQRESSQRPLSLQSPNFSAERIGCCGLLVLGAYLTQLK